jgi:hypothetical protein
MAKTPTDIRSLARSHTATAINTLVGVMRERKSSPSARVAAAVALMDRGWGKPSQAMEITQDRPLERLSDAELTAFLREIQQAKENNDG